MDVDDLKQVASKVGKLHLEETKISKSTRKNAKSGGETKAVAEAYGNRDMR
jgi:hypothetical protein